MKVAEGRKGGKIQAELARGANGSGFRVRGVRSIELRLLN